MSIGALLADPTLYGPESRWTGPPPAPVPPLPIDAWHALLREPGQPCDCPRCASRDEAEPVPPLPDGHRETD